MGNMRQHRPGGAVGQARDGVADALRRLVDALPVVTYVADASGGELRFVSAAIDELLGYPPQEWLADAALREDRLHPQDRYRVLHERAQARSEGIAFSSEYRFVARTGGTVWVRDQATLQGGLALAEGTGGAAQEPSWWGVMLDVTDRRRAEEELRMRAAQHSALALLSQRALLLHDRRQLLEEAADLLRETLGVDAALVVEGRRTGRGFAVTVCAGEASVQRDVPPGTIVEQALAASGPVMVTDRRFGPGGGIPLDPAAVATAAVAVEAPGAAPAVLVVKSRRPRVFTREDADLLRGVANVLASALGRMTSDAQLGQETKLDALGRLAAGVAHDFNNILTAVLGFGALLEPAVREDPRAASHLAELRAAAERAVGVVDQLLAFSRGQPGAPVELDLDEVVAGIRGMLVQLLPAEVELVHEPSAVPARVRVDRGQLEQVLVNLVVNARDAMPAGGSLVLRTRRAAAGEVDREPLRLAGTDHVVLEVEDEGIGMSTETVEQVFDPFFTTKPAGAGTGLGLATVLGIVQRHGGAVGLESEVGRGTRVRVHLPAVGPGGGDAPVG